MTAFQQPLEARPVRTFVVTKLSRPASESMLNIAKAAETLGNQFWQSPDVRRHFPGYRAFCRYLEDHIRRVRSLHPDDLPRGHWATRFANPSVEPRAWRDRYELASQCGSREVYFLPAGTYFMPVRCLVIIEPAVGPRPRRNRVLVDDQHRVLTAPSRAQLMVIARRFRLNVVLSVSG